MDKERHIKQSNQNAKFYLKEDQKLELTLIVSYSIMFGILFMTGDTLYGFIVSIISGLIFGLYIPVIFMLYIAKGIKTINPKVMYKYCKEASNNSTYRRENIHEQEISK